MIHFQLLELLNIFHLEYWDTYRDECRCVSRDCRDAELVYTYIDLLVLSASRFQWKFSPTRFSCASHPLNIILPLSLSQSLFLSLSISLIFSLSLSLSLFHFTRFRHSIIVKLLTQEAYTLIENHNTGLFSHPFIFPNFILPTRWVSHHWKLLFFDYVISPTLHEDNH